MKTDVKGTSKDVMKESKRDDLPGQGAKVAFYAFLSIFPLLLVMLSLTGIIGGDRAFNYIMGWLESSLPSQAAGIFEQYVREITQQSAPGILSVGLLLTLWSASAGFAALGESLDSVFDVEETRSFFKRRAIAVAFALGVGVLLVALAVLVVGGPEIFSALGLGAAWSFVRWPIAFAVLAGILYMVYRFLPDHDARGQSRALAVGAVVGALLWVLATALFRLYVANFGSYAKTYGAVGAVIVLLLWLQISAVIILLGGEVASALAKRRAHAPARGRPSYA